MELFFFINNNLVNRLIWVFLKFGGNNFLTGQIQNFVDFEFSTKTLFHCFKWDNQIDKQVFHDKALFTIS